jgi:hypothetical protein
MSADVSVEHTAPIIGSRSNPSVQASRTTLKMEELLSQQSVNFRQNTLRHILEDRTLLHFTLIEFASTLLSSCSQGAGSLVACSGLICPVDSSAVFHSSLFRVACNSLSLLLYVLSTCRIHLVLYFEIFLTGPIFHLIIP